MDKCPDTIPEHLAKSLREQGVDPSTIPVLKSREEAKEYFKKYGLPNSVSNPDGTPRFGHGDSLFIDDDTGKPVAYAPDFEPNKRGGREL